MFPCFELGSIPCELKWINKVYKLGKVGCRSPIDPGAKKKKKKKKKKIRIEKDDFIKLELGSRLDWKLVETFVINC